MTKSLKILVTLVVSVVLFVRLCLGFFVIQPIGLIPKGTTIVYWRLGTNYDFVESADGIVKKTGLGLSLWTRAIALGTIAEPIMKRELFRMAYSEFLYLTSTNGEAYDR